MVEENVTYIELAMCFRLQCVAAASKAKNRPSEGEGREAEDARERGHVVRCHT